MHTASVASLRQSYFLPRHQLGKAEGRCVTFKPVFLQARALGRLDSNNTIDCEHFASCSGCTLADSTQPQVLSEARNFFRTVKYPEEVQLFLGPQRDWRCRARLAVRGNAGDVKIGLFQAGSHDVVDIPNCRIHHPRINTAVHLIRQVANTLRIPPYNEVDGKGKLRYIQLTAAGTDPGTPNAHLDSYACIQVVVVWNGAANESMLLKLATTLQQHNDKCGPRPLIHSVWANFNAARVNTVFGHHFQHLHGSHWLWQEFGGAKACFSPGSFMQANFGAMNEALLDIQEAVPRGATVADLHAGVGVIGLSLAATRSCRAVRCVEISPHGRHAFQQAHAALEQRLGRAVAMEYIVAPAESQPDTFLEGMEVCVVDPPRKGIAPALVAALCQPMEITNELRKLVYLSCGFSAFKRDCILLLDSKFWVLKFVRCFLFFPGTDSIETLAVFERISE